MKKLFIPATVIAVTTLSVSCATNRPAPADANGREWSSEIRKSYPDWQPPAEMPQGNPEYNAMFDGKDTATADPVKDTKDSTPVADADKKTGDAGLVAVDTVEITKTDEKAGKDDKQETAAADDGKPAEFARIDIEAMDGDLLLNGFEKTDADMEAYLKSAVAQVPDFAIIILYEESAADRMRAFTDKAKQLGVKKINALTRKDLLNMQLDLVAGKVGKAQISELMAAMEAKAKAEEALKGAKMISVVDDTKDPTTYTVVDGDSLSIIAKKLYHDGALWPILLEANKEALNGNPDKLSIGKKLNIPVLKQVPVSPK